MLLLFSLAFLYLFVGMVVFLIFSTCGVDLETCLTMALTWPKLWWTDGS